jgi:hypothetical protein
VVLAANDCVHLPGRLERRGVAQNQNGGPGQLQPLFSGWTSAVYALEVNRQRKTLPQATQVGLGIIVKLTFPSND